MDWHKLGKTDIKVSALAMGCWAIAGDPLRGALTKTAGGIERFIRAVVERSVQEMPQLLGGRFFGWAELSFYRISIREIAT